MDEERVLNLIYSLLDEYDRSLWENIRYIDLADKWLEIVDESYKTLKKKANGDVMKVSIVELGELRRSMLLEYLKGEK